MNVGVLSPNVTMIPVKKTIGNRTIEDKEQKIRVAAYCRVSTDREEQESSYEVQVQHYTDYINSNPKWQLAGIFADDGISATSTKNRDAFNDMIEKCMKGKIDMIITKSISRFARNTMDCLKYVRQLKEKRIPIVFEKENINTMESKGEVLLTIMASLAQQESESLSKNVLLGLQFRYQSGQVMVNHNRFLGYTREKKGGPLIVVPEEAAIVRRIYREFLEGKSIQNVARGLEADGIKTGAGRTKWHASCVHKILQNEKYMGDALLQKTFTANTLDKVRLKNTGEMPQYYVEGSQEAIVSKEMFARVQQELARRASFTVTEDGKRHKYESKYALSGIVICGLCGHHYRRITWNNRGCRSIVWRCQHRIEDGKEMCSSRTVNEETLQKAVIDAVNSILFYKDSFMEVLRESLKECLADGNSEKVEKLNEKIRKLQEQLLKCAMDNRDFERLDTEILELKRQKAELLNDTVADKVKEERIESIMEFVGSQEGFIENYDESIVRNFVEKIEIFEDRITVVLKSGESLVVAA